MNHVRPDLLFAATALALAGLWPALASAQAATLMGDCAPDLRRLCAAEKPGGGRMLACLQKNEAQLTPACKAQLPLAAQCTGEVRRICGERTPREWRDCFAAKADQFSATCRAAAPKP